MNVRVDFLFCAKILGPTEGGTRAYTHTYTHITACVPDSDRGRAVVGKRR